MRRFSVAVLAGCFLFGSHARAGDPPSASGKAWIKSHRITARFEPATHRIIATDTMTFDVASGRAVAFELRALPFAMSSGVQEISIGLRTFGCVLPDGVDHVSISYTRTVRDEDERGIVSEQGIRLAGATGWYPTDVDTDTAPHLARFDVTTYVPEPFLVVTQGRAPERARVLAPKGWTSDTIVVPPTAKAGEETTAYAVSTALAQMPTPDLALSAGPYQATTRTIEGIEISTYFLGADGAPLWLDALGDVISRYESRLGTYPHAKYDLVEDGAGVNRSAPSFALLGSDRLRTMTAAARGPGGAPLRDVLSRAYVAGWFGHALVADPAGRNWAEPLATYLATHAAREPSPEDGGRDVRRASLADPPRTTRAEGRADATDLLVFHALRRRLGDEAFFARLTRLAEDRVGTLVTWDDVLAALDGAWARPLVERRDLPTLRVVAASRWPGPKRSLNSDVRVEIVAEVAAGAAPWPAIEVPLALDGEVVGSVTVADGAGTWTGNVNGLPKAVELDPAFEVLRAIGPPTDTHRDLADGGRMALDVHEILRVLGQGDPGSWRDPERFLTSRLESLVGAKPDPVDSSVPVAASGVADLTSSRDLTITTETGTVVLKDAFRPICTSPPRAKGTPLEFGEGDHPVPLPGRIPDTSIEGLERFWKQIELGVAPALLLLPNPAARKALASLVDAPNALTAESEAALAAPGPDGAARPRPPLGPWIAERRAKAFPGLRALRIPVLLITDEAYEKIFDLKDVRTIDFEVSFAPATAKGPAGPAPAALVSTWMPPELPVERPPVIVVSARVGGPGQGDDASTGVACVMGALDDFEKTAAGAKRGLVVCLFTGKFSFDATTSLATDLAKRFDIRALIDVGRVGVLRDDTVSLASFSRDAELRAATAESLPSAGLRIAAYAPSDAALTDEPACFVGAGVRPVVMVRATPRLTSIRDLGRREPPIDPAGVARVSVAVRALLRRLLTAP